MTVFMIGAFLCSGRRRARRVLANVAREEVGVVGGIIGSTREEEGWSRNLLKWRYPGGGGYRHLIYDPMLREEERAQGSNRSVFLGGVNRSDPYYLLP